jgi:hypothetical protein
VAGKRVRPGAQDATELVVGGHRAQLQQDRSQVGDVNGAPDVVVEQGAFGLTGSGPVELDLVDLLDTRQQVEPEQAGDATTR